MPRSIRWRLQLWYTAVLLAVVGGFAGLLYYRVGAARLLEIDTGLTAAVQYLDVSLRALPEDGGEGREPGHPLPPPRPPWRGERGLPGGWPPRGPGPGRPGPPPGEDEDRPGPPPHMNRP